jgi:hypothetical protein
MLITTGSITWAKQGRLRSSPGARRPTRKLVAGKRAPRPPTLRRRALRPGEPGPPALRPPTLRRRALPLGEPGPPTVRQPTARAVVPMVGAACCRVGMLRQGRQQLTRRPARSPLTCLLAAASEVPPNGRAMGIARRSPDFRSRARRGTRTPPLMRRRLRCRPVLRGQGRGGRGQTTAGRSPMATGCSQVAARPCRSRARHGR